MASQTRARFTLVVFWRGGAVFQTLPSQNYAETCSKAISLKTFASARRSTEIWMHTRAYS